MTARDAFLAELWRAFRLRTPDLQWARIPVRLYPRGPVLRHPPALDQAPRSAADGKVERTNPFRWRYSADASREARALRRPSGCLAAVIQAADTNGRREVKLGETQKLERQALTDVVVALSSAMPLCHPLLS